MGDEVEVAVLLKDKARLSFALFGAQKLEARLKLSRLAHVVGEGKPDVSVLTLEWQRGRAHCISAALDGSAGTALALAGDDQETDVAAGTCVVS